MFVPLVANLEVSFMHESVTLYIMTMCCFILTQALKMFYKDYRLYSSLSDRRLKSSGTIQVKVPNNHDGWTVYTSDCQVIQGSRHNIF